MYSRWYEDGSERKKMRDKVVTRKENECRQLFFWPPPPGRQQQMAKGTEETCQGAGAPPMAYHRRWSICTMAGDMVAGGLVTRIPVLGLMMAMGFRERTADGW